MSREIDLLIDHIGTMLTMAGARAPRSGAEMDDVGPVDDAAIAVRDGRILSCGPRDRVLGDIEGSPVREHVDAGGRLLTPGFVDPHTHSVFAGRREGEFEQKVRGVSYQKIAEEGGGILNTVTSVRKASVDDLIRESIPRLQVMLSHGTTTVEVKSGYGLTTEDELKMLDAVKRLDETVPVTLVPTFLGAHEFPPEYRDRRDEYVDLVVDDMLPAVARAGTARFCDVFCEIGWFDRDQSRRILTKARELGLGLRLHADEFQPSGGAELAAEMGAHSADHLVAVTEEGMRRMKEAGVIATLLPGTVFFLDLPRRPPVKRMMELGLPIALSSDFNPGSSMTQNMQLMMTLGCVHLKISPAACFTASTINAAHALGVAGEMGSIEAGKRADLILFEADDHRTIPYNYGINHCHTVFKDGVAVSFAGRPAP